MGDHALGNSRRGTRLEQILPSEQSVNVSIRRSCKTKNKIALRMPKRLV